MYSIRLNDPLSCALWKRNVGHYSFVDLLKQASVGSRSVWSFVSVQNETRQGPGLNHSTNRAKMRDVHVINIFELRDPMADTNEAIRGVLLASVYVRE